MTKADTFARRLSSITLGLLCLTACVQGLSLWFQVQAGRERIHMSRVRADNRCDSYPSDRSPGPCYVVGWNMDERDEHGQPLHVDSTGFVDGWRGARDDHGFPVVSPEAKRMTAAKCPDANPLWVEAHGKCPVYA
jgi:hypothetical protein